MPLEQQTPLHHRRHRPPGAAQLGKQCLGEARTVRRSQTGLGLTANQLAGTRVAVSRLTVERLHPGQ